MKHQDEQCTNKEMTYLTTIDSSLIAGVQSDCTLEVGCPSSCEKIPPNHLNSSIKELKIRKKRNKR